MSKHLLLSGKTTEFTIRRSNKNNLLFGKRQFSISKALVFYSLVVLGCTSLFALYYLGMVGIYTVLIGSVLLFAMSIYRYMKPVLEMNLDFRLTEAEQKEINEDLWR